MGNRYGFAGERRDDVTGMYYLRARYYSSGIGRFTQADTYHGDGLNLYVYVGNNPVRYVDPSGHCCKDGGVDKNSYGNSSLIFGDDDLVYGPSAGGKLSELQESAGGKLLSDIGNQYDMGTAQIG